jgi:hypothetical protein
LTLAALLALVAAVLASGCSADPPQPRWEEVTSGSFTGAETERLDLGTLYLTGQVRLAWDLSGPSDARAEFRLKAVRATDDDPSEGATVFVSSMNENFAPQSDAALEVFREPDYYRVTLVQKLRPPGGVGYAGTFTLYTQDLGWGVGGGGL